MIEQAKGRASTGSAFCFCLIILYGASTADEVHDDGDERKQKQQMNQKAADMHNEEPTQPKDDQHHSKNKKHRKPAFSIKATCW
jgi:hypothetical protein